MTPERWVRVRGLFDEAVARAPDARAEFLATVCGDDDELRAEIRSLLAADTGPSPAVLDADSGGIAAAMGTLGDAAPWTVRDGEPESGASAGPHAGQIIGPYRVSHEIGRGGMGTVLLAEREDVGKRVALKVLRAGRQHPAAVRRLLAERRVLARLEHPNIARLLDAGVTDDGVPWFAMEYVDGAPIVAACDRQRFAVRDRLPLFLHVCDAVAYAHRNLVVHRDLKPSNVLVTADGTVKLLDFGIAKLLSTADGDADRFAADGTPGREELTNSAWLMTPRYAAPEQRRGGPVTTATDVYALGLLLGELLTGRPDAAAAAVARARGTTPAGLRSALAGDLDAIIRRATADDPAARYADAERLADDVRRHLAALPVRARRTTLRYRFSKLVQRHRTATIAGSIAIAAAVATTVGFVRQYRATGAALDRARLEAATSARVTEFTTGLFTGGDPWQGTGAATTAGELLARAGARVDSLRAEPLVQARLLAVLGRLNRELGRLDIADGQLARAVTAQRRTPGRDSLDLATSLAEYGLVSRDAGDLNRAATMLRQALAIRRAALGEDAPLVGATLADLATVARVRGEYANAESMFRRALAVERPPGAPPSAGLQTMANLGRLLGARGRYAEGDSVLRRLIELTRATYGPRHALIASALFDLSFFAGSRGDRVGADTLLDAARRIVAAEEGTGTKRYLELLTGSVETRRAAGRVRDADSLGMLGLRLSAPLRAAGSPSGVGILHEVARLRADRGDIAHALALAQKADALERRRGPASPTYYDGGATLVEVYVAAGHIVAADSTLRAIAPGVTAPARDSASHAWYTLWRAIVDDAMGRSAAAEPGFRAMLAARRATLPADDFLVAELESRLGRCLVHLGRVDAGMPLLRSSVATLRATRGAEDAYTRAAAARLAASGAGAR